MKKPESNDNYLYFDITKQERDSAIRYLLGIIINTRTNSKFPTNGHGFDEDVNVYLAHLLFAVSLPEYHEMAEPYLSMNTSDVLRWVRATEDRTIRYFIFKVNADHILVHSAVFGDLGQNDPQKFFKRPEKHYIEVARLYYDQAAAYHKRIYRKETGVGEVLSKLAHYFNQYQNLLKDIRRDYFHFVNSFRDQAFKHFVHEFHHYESDFQKRTKMDAFLDLYGRWLETKDSSLLEPLRRSVAELKELDSQFEFDVDRQLYGEEESGDEKRCA